MVRSELPFSCIPNRWSLLLPHVVAHQTLDGFILTRQALDQSSTSSSEQGEHCAIVLWLATVQGPVRVVYAQEPVQFFILLARQEEALHVFRQHRIRGHLRRTGLQTFAGDAVLACCFPTLARFYRALELLQLQRIPVFEGDVRHAERVLMERFITGGIRVSGDVTRHPG